MRQLTSESSIRFYVTVIVVLLLHVFGSMWLGYSTWGANIWAIAPVWAAPAAAFLVFLTILLPCKGLHERLNRAIRAIPEGTAQFSRTLLGRGLAFVILVVVLYLVRSRMLLYGDGYIAISNTTLPWSETIHSIHELLKPLSIVLYKFHYVTLRSLLDVTPESAFGLCSAIGGAFGWVGLYRLVQSIAEGKELQSRRHFLFAAACTSGVVLLFCGHMELYVWAGACYLWFLSYCYKGSHGKALLYGLLATAFNVMLAPAIAAVLILVSRNHGFKLLTIVTPVRLLVSIALASSVVAILLQWFGIEYGTVPIIAHEGNTYALLSLDHLGDLLNVILFAAPLAIALVYKRGTVQLFKEHWILVFAFTVPFLVAVWIDVDAGAARDWDLLSFFGLPLTLFAALALDSTVGSRATRKMTFSLICLALFLLAPHFYERINRSAAVDRLHAIILNDPHYQPEYKQGLRNVSWSALLNDNFGRPDLAEIYAKRRVSAAPTSVDDLSNLALIFVKQNKLDSAEVYFRMARTLDPFNDNYRSLLQQVLLLQTKYELAAELLPLNATGDSAQVAFLRECGNALLADGKYHPAITCYLRADSLNGGSWIDRFAIAAVHMRFGDMDSATVYLRQSENLCPDSFLCQFYQGTIKSLVKYGGESLAKSYLTRSVRRCGDLVDDLTRARIVGSN